MPTSRLVQPAIRRIRKTDAEAWRDVRLRALLDAPEAFGSTHADAVAQPPEYWPERALQSASGQEQAIFLADAGDELVGLVGGFRRADERGKNDLISMWVAPSHRGTRLARRLIQQVLDWSASGEAKRVNLWFTETNQPARRSYERAGFTVTGTQQPHPSSPPLNELEMTYPLSGYVVIRRIQPHEAEIWRATRIAALSDAPDAFGPTAEETLQRSLAHWTDRIADAASSDRLAVFAAVRGQQWLGLAGAGTTWAAEHDRDGTVHLGSVWLAPKIRGGGLLPRLLDAAYDWAVGTGAERIALDVTETNKRAIGIYERYGYRLTGRRQPLRPGSDLDELEMVLEFHTPKEAP